MKTIIRKLRDKIRIKYLHIHHKRLTIPVCILPTTGGTIQVNYMYQGFF